MKKFLSILLSAVMLITMSASVFADETDGKETIRVGINAEFAPFEYYENGELKGFDIDLMNYVGERIGCDIEFVNMPFDALIPAVVSGEIDCAISAISITEERDKIIDYSRDYLMTNVITYENGQKSVRRGEYFAVVFREGLSGSPYKELTNPTDDEKLYILIDTAIRDLSQDRTVMKLIEKYELNKPCDEEAECSIEYQDIRSCGTPAAKTEYTDAVTTATSIPPSDWAQESILKAEELNIIEQSRNYAYPEPVTREAFCELAYNCLTAMGKTAPAENQNKFTDTENAKVVALSNMGIIKGKSETQFAPADFITREEAATVLNRMSDCMGIKIGAVDAIAYVDEAAISDWAKASVYNMRAIGVMQGTDTGFSPKDSYTAEQSIATLVRLNAAYNLQKSDLFADRLSTYMPDNENYMFSPISAKMALALAANGAEGETKEEILKTMGIKNLDEFNATSKDLIERYSKAENLKLNIANSIWINESEIPWNFSDTYKNTIAEFYDGEARKVNGANMVETVNGWVSEKTNGKIDRIIEKNDYAAMLINAIYFKGAWQSEFLKGATKQDEFENFDGTKSQTDFMNKTTYFNYSEKDGAQIVELPYKNSFAKLGENGEYAGVENYDTDVSMYLIMSEGEVEADKLLTSATANNEFESTYVKLSMPKFKIESTIPLNAILKDMGIKKAYDKWKAEFGKMFDSGNMYIVDALQKTYINVDEEGTEAAAVTAFAGGVTSVPNFPEPIELKFNKPFTFAIRDNTSGEILFMGRFVTAK